MRDGLSWVNLQGALMAGGWKAGGQLCCLLGLSPCWAVIKSRSWCEAFLAGQQWASVPGELGCVPEKTCYRVPVICFSDFIVIVIPSQDFFFFSYHGPNTSLTDTCPESQVVIVNVPDIKYKIRLDFDALQ